VIYYRIYLSDISTGAVDTGTDRSSINQQMASNYNSIFPWTDTTNTNVNTPGLHAFFTNNMGFSELELEGTAINGVLGSGATGQDLEINFENITSRIPTLSLGGGTPYDLRRARQRAGTSFNPVPNISGALPFLSNFQLLDRTNISDTVNADVQDKANVSLNSAYVMMYIVATGLDGWIRVFSQPTYLGIFRLPNQ
jgi:hypothetical protein